MSTGKVDVHSAVYLQNSWAGAKIGLSDCQVDWQLTIRN